MLVDWLLEVAELIELRDAYTNFENLIPELDYADTLAELLGLRNDDKIFERLIFEAANAQAQIKARLQELKRAKELERILEPIDLERLEILVEQAEQGADIGLSGVDLSELPSPSPGFEKTRDWIFLLHLYSVIKLQGFERIYDKYVG